MRLTLRTMMDGKNSYYGGTAAPTVEDWNRELCLQRFDDKTLANAKMTFYRGPSVSSNKAMADALHTSNTCWGLRTSPGSPPNKPSAVAISLADLGSDSFDVGDVCPGCFTYSSAIPAARAAHPQIGYESILEIVRNQVGYMPGKLERARSANGRIKLRAELLETATYLKQINCAGAHPDQIDERDRLLEELQRLAGKAADALNEGGNAMADSVVAKIRAETGVGDALLDETPTIVGGRVGALGSNILAKLAVEAYTVCKDDDKVVLRCPAFVWMWLLGRERRRRSWTVATSWPDDIEDDRVLRMAVVLFDPSPTSELRTIGAAIEAASLLNNT